MVMYMIMTYEMILEVKEYNGVKITDKIRQKAIDMTEQLDLLSYHEGLDIVLDDMELVINEEAEETTKKAKTVQKEMTKAQSDKKVDKPKKVDTLAKVKTQKAKKKVDENKDNIIEAMVEFTSDNEFIINPQVIKNGHISFKDKDGNYYSLKLTKHKSKPDGYTD